MLGVQEDQRTSTNMLCACKAKHRCFLFENRLCTCQHNPIRVCVGCSSALKQYLQHFEEFQHLLRPLQPVMLPHRRPLAWSSAAQAGSCRQALTLLRLVLPRPSCLSVRLQRVCHRKLFPNNFPGAGAAVVWLLHNGVHWRLQAACI